MDGRRHQQRRVEVAVGGQRRSYILLEIGGHLRGARQDVRRLADDDDVFLDCGRPEGDIQRQRLSGGNCGGPLLLLKPR